MPHLIDLVEQALRKARVKREELLGIGVGISGILDRSTGTTLYWPKVPQWVNVPVRQIFTDHFGIAPEIEDTPRTMALAERRLGLARQADNWVYLMLGRVCRFRGFHKSQPLHRQPGIFGRVRPLQYQR